MIIKLDRRACVRVCVCARARMRVCCRMGGAGVVLKYYASFCNSFNFRYFAKKIESKLWYIFSLLSFGTALYQ